MEFIKQNFSIKDLEHLTGVKAHTIRIWEKRYDILQPARTGSNIRTYDISDLQKILNVTFLNGHGYKISRISKLSDDEIIDLVKSVAATKSEQSRALNSFKIAMINFDQTLFDRTYRELEERRDFRTIFHQIFLPLLDEIGILWQTKAIHPVHEHFLAALIKQKLYENIALLENEEVLKEDELFVLFLPENEIHDLGLLFLNYELNFHGCKTIFLGPSLPLNNMKYILDIHPNPRFISYLTVAPREVSEFITEFERELCGDVNRELNLFGAKIQSLDPTRQPPHIKIFKSIPEFVNDLV
ncbi:MAG TPA: MerR family transcriptional regulator [Gillisia sp.]|nr:MerR family transcriptional regulator [Gillisia sp.]